MCLAMPAVIVSIHQEHESAVVNLGGINKEISLALVENVALGDYVLVHTGFALNKLDEEEAELTLKAFDELAKLR